MEQIALGKGPHLSNQVLEEDLQNVVPNYTLSVRAPLSVVNHLPCNLTVEHQSLTLYLDPGAMSDLYDLDFNKQIDFKLHVS